MSKPRAQCALAATISLLAFTTALPLEAQQTGTPSAAPDANLYTTYAFGTGYQNVDWSVCGSTQASEGCYDFGSLGPFGKVGALIEGNPSVSTSTSTVTRYLYIVDIAAGSGTDVIYVYKKTDVLSSS